MSDKALFSFNLPEELFHNIVLRLPVKSILVCTCVCKSWNSLFKSPSFVSSHLNRTIASYKESDNHPYLLQLCSRFEVPEVDSFSLGFDEQELSDFSPVDFPYRGQDEFQVICSCNGLVLLMIEKYHLKRHGLILWNPSIRKSVIIQKRKTCLTIAAGLAFDSKTCDYKVLTIFNTEDLVTLKVELYSFGTNSWKQLPNFEAYLCRYSQPNREMVFLNDTLHILAYSESCEGSVILGFNLDGEVFREIKLPECVSTDFEYSSFWIFEESLSVIGKKSIVRNLELQIWVMKKYGVEDSWSHLSTVRLEEYPPGWILNWSFCRKSGHILMSFCSLLVHDASQMVLHDPRSQETKYVDYLNGKHVCFLGNYVESLILSDKENDFSNPALSSLKKYFK